MIVSPKKKKCVVEVGEYKGQTHITVWRMGEFAVDVVPELQGDGSITLSPSSMLGCWDEWETTIPGELRRWDFDKQAIFGGDFEEEYKIVYYKILHGFEINGVKIG